MASQIEIFDGAYRPDYEPESWHKQEDAVPGKITEKRQISRVAYPIIVEDYPLPPGYFIANNGCSKVIVAKHPERNIILGTCSPEYVPFGNDQIFDTVMEAFKVNDISADLVFALTMKNAQMVSYSFEIKDTSKFLAGGRPHKMYACFSNAHNKTQKLIGCGTATNVLCANTHNLMMRGEKHGFNFSWGHNKKDHRSFEELKELLNSVKHSAELYSKLADQMVNKPINLTQAQAIAMSILSKKEKASKQTFNHATEIARLFTKEGIGNSGENLFDLFNGATQHFTHGEGVGKNVVGMKRLFSSEFGNGAEKKDTFLLTFQDEEGELISDSDIDNLVKSGEKLLKEYA